MTPEELLTIECNRTTGIASCFDCLIKSVHSLPDEWRQQVLSSFNREMAVQSLVKHELGTLSVESAEAGAEWGHRVNWPPSTP